LASGGQATATAFYTTGSAGLGSVSLSAQGTTGGLPDDGIYEVPVVSYTVSVTPDDRGVGVLASQTGRTQTFTIQHAGSASATYNFDVLCTGTLVSGCTIPSPVTLASGASTTVNVTYNSASSGTGRIRLLATHSTNGAIKDSGWVNVALGTQQSPTVSVAGVNSGSVVERDLCLTIATGSDAASECGDLRIVHPLPRTRTLNKARTPTLVYSSQHAQPNPLIAAEVTLPAGAATPDTVVAKLTLTGNPTVRGQGKWAGSEWVPGRANRIVVADTLVPTLATGVYDYTLEVVNYYGSTPSTPGTSTGRYVVVNRTSSAFGAGWWLAGLEKLFFPSDTMKLWWVGGDGAFREYQRQTGTSIWRAPPVDRLDSLTRAGAPGSYTYTRYLPHGLKVQFDTGGRHTSTVNRLGHTTTFRYDGNGRLSKILLPPDTTISYQFVYNVTAGILDSVIAPPIGTVKRATKVTRSGSLVTAIRDPDLQTVRFAYDGATNRVASRTDRRGSVTTFTYDVGKKVNQSSLNMGSGKLAIVHRLRSLESLGIANSGTPSAVDTAVAYTMYNGPRVGIGDTTAFWLDSLGAPRRIINALGLETLLTRGNDTFPALVTKIRYPNLRVVTATYDGHGNITSSTDSSVAPQNGKYATTRFAWNTKWDFDSIIAPPEGDSTVMSYSDTNGNRVWQKDARGDTTRFAYYTADSVKGLLRSIRTPSQLWSDSRDSVEYNQVGNLFRTKTPLGFWTTDYSDAVGRDTLIRSPIDSAQSLWQTDTVRYDLADREILRKTVGPSVSYLTQKDPQPVNVAGQTLTVQRFYNPEGMLDSLSRSSSPDTNHLGVLTTRRRYDPAGRAVKEIASDGLADSTVYDPAGNSVQLLTRRGHLTKMAYDPLNRLSQRIVPSVTYPGEWVCVPDVCIRFPFYYWNLLTIPADTATFVYDSTGNLRRAWNGDARVSRGYNRDGTIAADTLMIRNWADANFSHIYVLQPSYDLDRRRTTLQHPGSIAPRIGQTIKDLQKYTYTPTGQLASVIDVLADTFKYFYDVEGRLDSLNVPGQMYEKHFYDVDGRLRRRVERKYYTWAPGDSGFTQDTIRNDTLSYDARDKIRRVKTFNAMEPGYVWSDSALTWYSGLGQVVATWKRDALNVQADIEEFRWDALANLQWKQVWNWGNGAGVPNGTRYEVTTGRLVVVGLLPGGTFPSVDSSRYDPSGNRDAWIEGQYCPYLCSGALYSQPPSSDYIYGATRMYYGADQRLRVLDRVPGRVVNEDAAHTTGAFEEYRYDALGRRILVRSRHDSICALTPTSPCASIYSAIERTVWDGDQVLYEIRYPGADNISNADLERDTATVYQQETPFGRVAYTHGLGIDRPLDVIRMGYTGPSGASSTWTGPVAVIPHQNWRGTFDQGTFDNGAYTRCTKRLVDPNKGYNTTDCVFVDWPGNNWLAFGGPEQNAEPTSWFGYQIGQGRDFSNQFYRRNRYYDAFEGRFTQEDPLGLAAGLNLYGFANGDPINFSDPFGLAQCPKSPTPRNLGEASGEVGGKAAGEVESGSRLLSRLGRFGRFLGRVGAWVGLVSLIFEEGDASPEAFAARDAAARDLVHTHVERPIVEPEPRTGAASASPPPSGGSSPPPGGGPPETSTTGGGGTVTNTTGSSTSSAGETRVHAGPKPCP